MRLDRALSGLSLLDPGWSATMQDEFAGWQEAARAGTLRDPGLLGFVAGWSISAALPASEWLPLAKLAL